MKLIVGLGNPGRRYEKTRHNVGFMVVSEVARRWATDTARQKFAGAFVEAALDGNKAGLLCPETYMNQSGKSVREAVDFYKLPLTDLLVICDDLNLPLARIRLRPNGSAGGQKGLADIIRVLGTEQFPRMRVGIGAAPPGWEVPDFVLSRFQEQEQSEIDLAIQRAADAVTVWIREGIETCMNQYNRA